MKNEKIQQEKNTEDAQPIRGAIFCSVPARPSPPGLLQLRLHKRRRRSLR